MELGSGNFVWLWSFFFFYSSQMDEVFFFFFFFSLTDGWSFFFQKLPFRHRISGSGWNFFLHCPRQQSFFFSLLKLVKFFFFQKLPCPLPGYQMVHPYLYPYVCYPCIAMGLFFPLTPKSTIRLRMTSLWRHNVRAPLKFWKYSQSLSICRPTKNR